MRLKGCLLYGGGALVLSVGLLIWVAVRTHPIFFDPVRDINTTVVGVFGGQHFSIPLGYLRHRVLEKDKVFNVSLIDFRFWFSDLSMEPKPDKSMGWSPYPDAQDVSRQEYDKHEEALVYVYLQKIGVGREYISPRQKLKNSQRDHFLHTVGKRDDYCSTGGKKISLNDDGCDFYQSDGKNQILTSCFTTEKNRGDFRRIIVDTAANEDGYYMTVFLSYALMKRWDEVEAKVWTLVNSWRQ